MAIKIITKGLNTGLTTGGPGFILTQGLASAPLPARLSVRGSIVAAIVNQLKKIHIMDGYNTDLNDCVTEWELTNIPLSNLPCVEVKDPSEETEIKGSLHYNTLNIELVGRIATTNINEARNFLTDMVVAMSKGPAFPDNVYQWEPSDKPGLLPEQADKAGVKITLSYEIKYRTSLF
jgi:hypothetical protein